MAKILAVIISFLLMLFPDSGTLLVYQQQLAFPGEKAVAEEIIDAIKNRDAESLINMYSEAAKSTGEITTENIERFFESFEGDVIHGDYLYADGGDHIAYGYGESHRQLRIEFKTNSETYRLYASWQIVDTENPQKVGLVQLTLFPKISSLEEYEGVLAQIPLNNSLTNVGS